MAGTNRLGLVSTASGELSSTHAFTTQVEAMADLKLTVNDPQGPIPVGEEATYEIRIINRGTKAAEGVKVVVYFSSGIEPIVVEGGRSKITPGQVEFDPLTRIDAGSEVVYTITAKAEKSGDHVCRTELECRNP